MASEQTKTNTAQPEFYAYYECKNHVPSFVFEKVNPRPNMASKCFKCREWKRRKWGVNIIVLVLLS